MTKYNPKDYSIQVPYKLNDSVFRHGLLLPDQHIYIACNVYYGKGFYVKARIIEMCYIHSWPNELERPGKWMSLYSIQPNPWEPNGVSDSVNEIPEGTDLTGSVIVNQFPWVDWPIGNAAYLGDCGFHTLEDARQTYGRFRAKGKYRRARRELSSVTKFIGDTHVMAGEDRPAFPKRSDFYRKIYV